MVASGGLWCIVIPCWLQLPAALVACARYFWVSHCIYIYIYIYICSSADWAQGYILPYMRICRAYMHIWSLANIYIGPIYMFAMFICVFLCNFHAAYMQMSAIWCKCMLCCTSSMDASIFYCSSPGKQGKKMRSVDLMSMPSDVQVSSTHSTKAATSSPEAGCMVKNASSNWSLVRPYLA